jgi:hypothetical protein
MPYDPTPVGADPLDAAGRRTTLTVQLQGAGDEPEAVLTIARPDPDGSVAVHERPAVGEPRRYQTTVHALEDRVRDVRRAGRRVSVELLLLHEFLHGRA